MTKTIRELEEAAAKIKSARLRSEVTYLIAGAIENAPNSEADQISTLETSLSYCDDDAACEWFDAQGFRW